MKKNLRIITFAWNESYINDLLDYSIAAVLAENNLPALIHEFNCTFVILSQKEQFEHIENHQNIKKIKKICKFELISIDDLITESWQ